jgi:hypothetical protein
MFKLSAYTALWFPLMFPLSVFSAGLGLVWLGKERIGLEPTSDLMDVCLFESHQHPPTSRDPRLGSLPEKLCCRGGVRADYKRKRCNLSIHYGEVKGTAPRVDVGGIAEERCEAPATLTLT